MGYNSPAAAPTIYRDGVAMSDAKLISCDSHIVEPADLWQGRTDRAWRDRAPRTETDADGIVHWYVDHDIPLGSVGAPAQAGVRFEDPSKVTFEGRWEEVRPGANDPEARLADMAMDGVIGEVVYPTVGARLYSVVGSELLSACLRANNDWMADFVKGRPDLFKGIGMLNTDDVDDAAKELARCAELGLAGAMIPTYPGEARPYDHPDYDRLWAAGQDLGMPLSFHIASPRQGPGQVAVFAGDGQGAGAAAYRATQDYWMRRSLAAMIFTGVFERYPALRIAVVEHELSWMPHLLTQLDRTYTELSQTAPYRFRDAKLPSDFFTTSIYTSFQEDRLGVQVLPERIGTDTLMWGSDYPHAESTWPNSQQFLADILAPLAEPDRAKLVHDNVARLFKFA